MRRTDRLFDLVQLLRDGQLHRAADLAAALGGVSPRTIWRDMATLIASGMPIEGERGVGYVLRVPTTLPPLMLTAAEMQALRQGLQAVAHGGDEGMARAARSLAAKIGAVAPSPAPTDPQSLEEDDLFAFTHEAAPRAEPLLPVLRAAISAGAWCQITALDAQDQPRHDRLRPLRILTEAGQRRLLAETADGARRKLGLDRILAVAP
jgi:predicted DNA-binding transcriptional regulator YafY